MLAAVTATAGALRHLDLWSSLRFTAGFCDDWKFVSKYQVDAMLRVAQGLLCFEADVWCSFEDAQALLPGHGQYSVVHIRRLVMGPKYNHLGEKVLTSIQDAMSLARDLRLHPFLQELGIYDVALRTPAVLGALVDAVIACGLTAVHFTSCFLGPQSATHLARLLRDAPRLLTLFIEGDDLFDAASSPIFAAALRTSSLTDLHLSFVELWQHDGVGHVLVDALVGHPTLQEISLNLNMIQFRDPLNTVGACLARLVAANSPSLHTLSLAHCEAGDAALRPIFAALPSNTNLRTLLLNGNKLSATFAHNVVLPSARANTALRKLEMVYMGSLYLTGLNEDGLCALLEAQAHVANADKNIEQLECVCRAVPATAASARAACAWSEPCGPARHDVATKDARILDITPQLVGARVDADVAAAANQAAAVAAAGSAGAAASAAAACAAATSAEVRAATSFVAALEANGPSSEAQLGVVTAAQAEMEARASRRAPPPSSKARC